MPRMMLIESSSLSSFFFLIFFEKCRQCGSGDSASKTLIRWSVPRSCNRVTRCHVTRNTSESMKHRRLRYIQWPQFQQEIVKAVHLTPQEQAAYKTLEIMVEALKEMMRSSAERGC